MGEMCGWYSLSDLSPARLLAGSKRFLIATVQATAVARSLSMHSGICARSRLRLLVQEET